MRFDGSVPGEPAGNVNSYTCRPTPTITGYAVGTSYWFRASTSDTGAATVNFSGLGAKPILKRYNQPLAAGDTQSDNEQP
jgi:hypothetical protein